MSLGLYLHYPFCQSICSYCDYCKTEFDSDQEKKYFQAIRAEAELLADLELVSSNPIQTIYLGGGTPSAMNLDLFARFFERLKTLFPLTENVEFSFELNPESTDDELLIALQKLGVNRPVFGIQTFDKPSLRLLGRRHQPWHAHRAIYLANALGFSNYSVDMLISLPGQSEKAMASDIEQLLDLKPPHISLYELTIEPGTELGEAFERGELKLTDKELLIARYHSSIESLLEAGYTRYEVSSFCQPGYECRHNLRYWSGNDYIGLGPSAVTQIGRQRWHNTSDINEYINRLSKGLTVQMKDESAPQQHMDEAIALGLRTARGIDRALFSKRFGVALEERINSEQYRLLIGSGHLVPDRGWLRLSVEGIDLADELTRRLLST